MGGGWWWLYCLKGITTTTMCSRDHHPTPATKYTIVQYEYEYEKYAYFSPPAGPPNGRALLGRRTSSAEYLFYYRTVALSGGADLTRKDITTAANYISCPLSSWTGGAACSHNLCVLCNHVGRRTSASNKVRPKYSNTADDARLLPQIRWGPVAQGRVAHYVGRSFRRHARAGCAPRGDR